MLTWVHSFDGTENVQAEVVKPDRYAALYSALSAGGAVIARGAGLSYCAAGAGRETRSIESVSFNRLLAFDGETGHVTVETGIRLGDLFRFTVPRGWILPVMPGHPAITVGGCIGCNVHGKNHYRDGCFINAVESLTLFHPDHGEILCSRTKESDLFQLTVGGFGLTGYVTSATLRLQRVAGASVRIERIAVASLAEAVSTMEAREESTLLYSWNDLNLTGSAFGRGFVYAGAAAADEASPMLVDHHLDPQQRGQGRLPIYSRLGTRFLTSLYAFTERTAAGHRLTSLASSSFPPNGKEFYFHLFGKRGFREYQVLVDRSRWKLFEQALPSLIQRHRAPVTLASLKLFKGEPHLLRFDGTGICLAINVPAGDPARTLFADLDELTLQAGGIVNLAKDSRLTAPFVKRIFPHYQTFRSQLNQFDPKRRFDSSLRRRLDV